MSLPKLALDAYYDRRMAKIFLIGIMSGLPWVLFSSVAVLWLKSEGFSLSSIGLFGYVTVVYALNFLWAPLVDAVRIPYLSKYLGKRKAYIFLMQAIILATSIVMSSLSLPAELWTIAACALIIASAGATQDVAIDALRIELVGQDEKPKVAAGAALATSGWWAGYSLGGAAALYYADWLRQQGVADPYPDTYLLIAGIIVVSNILLLLSREKTASEQGLAHKLTEESSIKRVGQWLKNTLWMPFYTFFARNGLLIASVLLAFIVFFKIGEAFLGRMSLAFYKDIGFSDSEIATYSKLAGWGVIIIFSIVGSLFSIRYGLLRGLIICGLAMAASNLLFAWLAVSGTNTSLLAFVAVVDQFTTAISTVAFVAFISQLCDRAYTATQYALLASMGNLARTTLSAHSGQLVDALGGDWVVFFILTAIAVLPSLFLLITFRKALRQYF